MQACFRSIDLIRNVSGTWTLRSALSAHNIDHCPVFSSLREQLAPKIASSLVLPAGIFIPCSAIYRGNGVRGEKKQWANKVESTILVIHFGVVDPESRQGQYGPSLALPPEKGRNRGHKVNLQASVNGIARSLSRQSPGGRPMEPNAQRRVYLNYDGFMADWVLGDASPAGQLNLKRGASALAFLVGDDVQLATFLARQLLGNKVGDGGIHILVKEAAIWTSFSDGMLWGQLYGPTALAHLILEWSWRLSCGPRLERGRFHSWRPHHPL